jgi:hypothetical protein
VRRLGYPEHRVRRYGSFGRLESPAPDLERALEPGERDAIRAAIRFAGYARASIDPRPFRSGRLN